MVLSDVLSFIPPGWADRPHRLALILFLAIPIVSLLHRSKRRGHRQRLISPASERVLVLGGTSGIGREIAQRYSKRGARVCIVGRRESELQKVEEECKQFKSDSDEQTILTVAGDFANPQDMVRVRDKLEEAWSGVDTVIVAAGVSALRPLMEIAGVQNSSPSTSLQQASAEDIEKTVQVVGAAQRGNYVGPLVSAVTFIPLLQFSSPSPSILLVSSLAAIIPAPTRSVYASTKGASLLLYQSLAIEHPSIKFSFIIPSTVEGDFRASAVDGGVVREANPNTHGLKRTFVAEECIKAVDGGDKVVLLPYLLPKIGHLLYWAFPSVVEKFASRKYNFTPT